MKWDAKRRRYIENGHVLRKAEIRKRIDEYVTHQQKEVDREANKLLIGAITSAAFFEWLRHKIAAWHSLAGTTAYGGSENMTNEQWKRVNEKILSELSFLQGFEAEAEHSLAAAEILADHVAAGIPEGLDSIVRERVAEALSKAAPSEAEAVIKATMREALADSLGAEEAAAIAESVAVDTEIASNLIGATIPNRAGMYTDALFATYENNVKSREQDAGAIGVRRVTEEDGNVCDGCEGAASPDYVPLDEIPDIGVFECGGRDRCSFEFSYEGVEPLTIDRRLTG